MRALVLGGTQFVSEAVARALIAHGHETFILTRGRREVRYRGLSGRYRADRKDAASMAQLRGKAFDAVFDCSGYDAEDVRVALDALLPDERTSYVFLSSGAVYLPSCAAVGENAPKGESAVWGAYGRGKLEAEEALIRRARQRGFTLSLVRPAYVYGPGNNLYRESCFFDAIARGREIAVPDGDVRTQFAYIDDVVCLSLSLAEAHGGVEAINCAHPEPVDWGRLVRAAAAAMGVEPRIKRVAYEGVLEPRSFFPFRDCTYVLDTGKLERLDACRPLIDLDEGLRRAYAWYREHGPAPADVKMTSVEVALAL